MGTVSKVGAMSNIAHFKSFSSCQRGDIPLGLRESFASDWIMCPYLIAVLLVFKTLYAAHYVRPVIPIEKNNVISPLNIEYPIAPSIQRHRIDRRKAGT